MIELVQVYRATCNQCGKSWLPRGEQPPRWCPRCHSRRWDGEPLRSRICQGCGRSWIPRISPFSVICPYCAAKKRQLTKRQITHPLVDPYVKLLKVIIREEARLG